MSWDRVHNRLHPLPGTARLAVDRRRDDPRHRAVPASTSAKAGPRLGELDEEFVLERRVGETFVLGTATWRIEAIEPHRSSSRRAEGQSALMPFWRGEDAPRTAELGEAVGALCREVAERLDDPALLDWLGAECRLDADAARVAPRPRRPPGPGRRGRPRRPDGPVETFRDPAGEIGLAVLTPFGGKLHQALKLALQGRLRAAAGDHRRLPPRRRRPPDPPAPDRRAAARPLRRPDRRPWPRR